MEKAPSNKMQGNDTDKDVKGIEYFYPDYGVTITATSQEEANAKLAEIIKSKQ